ncbi:MAG TPA: hypothetical protein VFM09_02750 [Marmoricola sp.]|nr:hypothetical protein [Marmoricola sp.]
MTLSPYPMTLAVVRIQHEQMLAEAARRRQAREARGGAGATSPTPPRPRRFDWLITMLGARPGHPQTAR